MTNHITRAERERIIARAKQLTTQYGNNHDLVIALLEAEFNINTARARSALGHVIRQSNRPGAQPGNRNAAKPEYLKRVVYFNARLPQWLCDWLDSQPDRGRLIEAALIEKYNLEPPTG